MIVDRTERGSESYVSGKVNSLLAEFERANGPLRAPIDPSQLARLCGVLSVERRPMIPEGVLEPVPQGFRIYIQGNFDKQRAMARRQRFTVAHELAHTFYYESDGEVPRPAKGSPRGVRLERLCHHAAGQILVPDRLIKREIQVNGEISSGQAIFKLAEAFDVSTEVMVRRLHQAGSLTEYNFAAILVDDSHGDNRTIKAACYQPPLLSVAPRPATSSSFDAWVRPLLPPSAFPADSEWTHVAKSTRITAKKFSRSRREFILELKFDRP
jgi:hypothetical protein